MATLKLANINKVYPNNVQAVFDFNIDIKDKEFIVFVGPSGCGKSTTLRMVAGLEQITEGDLYIDDERMNAIEPKARNIAMVFQNYALYPHMTVYNNMAFALKLRKVNKPVYAIDKKNPDYLTKKKELYESYKKKLEEGLTKLKSERAVQLRKKEFKFDAKNALRVELLHLDEKYAKPVLTYDKDKVDQLLDAIKQEKNKKNDLVAKLTKEIKAEQNKPQTEVDSLSKEVKKQENALVSLTKEYQKIIKRAYEPGRIKELENELKATTLKFEKKIANLKKQLDDASKLKVDEKKIAELNKQLEAANSLTIDENKIKKLEDEIAAVKAKENVQAYRFAHYNKNEIAAKVTEAANILGLTQYLLRKPAALSGGQRQRVALGRSIVRKPKVFLMDEPLSNLDAKLRVQMRTELTKIHKDVKATTIYVTHDQTEAMTMANRIVVMKAGYVQQIATPEEVYAHPANLFVATFIGSPAMNIIKGVYDGKALNIDNKLKITLPPSFKKVHNQFYVDQKEISLKEIQKISDDLDRILEKKKLKKHMSAIKQREELLAMHRNIIENCDKCLKAKSHELYFGIRPEDIYLPKDKNNHNPSNKFKVKVDSYELLGHELNIYSKLAGSNFVFRISANNKVNESSNLEVCLDLKKIHIFDIASTKRIG